MTVMLAAPAAYVAAADFFINSGDVLALIAAIDTANSNGEANTIHLAKGGTYTLTAVHNDGFDGPTGLPLIASSLIINGNGATIQRDPFAPAFRFFRANHAAALTINDLTMLGGSSGGSGGGAIRSGAFGGGLTLNNCTIDSCAGSSGGAIFISEGTATLNDSTITWCSAGAHGGGIYNFDGNVTLNNTSVANGFATLGGGIFNAESAVTLVGSAVSDCFASQGGGGIHNADGTITLNDSTIADNSSGAGAGGIYNGRTALITDCTICNNTASGAGGGILNVHTTLINGCIMSNNMAGGAGGGIHSIHTLALTNTTISGNSSGDLGGGISTINAVNLTSLIGCNITGNSAGERGGGIYNRSAAMSLTGCTVSDNILPPIVQSRGGGIYNMNADLDLTDSEVSGNSSPHWGGGIYHNNGTVTIMRSTIAGNVSKVDFLAGGQGGGLRTNNGNVTISDSTISGNIALHDFSELGTGGGILNVGQSTLTMTNCTVSGNTAVWGGGLRNSNSALTLTNCTVFANAGLPETGGGMYTTPNDDSVVTVTNTIVAGSIPKTSFGDAGDIAGDYTDAGFNIIEDGVGLTHPTSMDGDPLLALLADNGGPTLTHALLPGSIAIDAGDCANGTITVDQRGCSRPNGATCDIGAFERHAGDLTGDCGVDGQDLLILLSAWGNCADAGDCPADLNNDSVVDGLDLLILLANWG